jgi:hypothetical protein
MDDPLTKLPFVHETLSTLRAEVGGASTVLGFIGEGSGDEAGAERGGAGQGGVERSTAGPGSEGGRAPVRVLTGSSSAERMGRECAGAELSGAEPS